MSAAVDYLLAELRRHHVRIERHGDRLRMKAPAAPPDDVLASVRRLKPELLLVLPDADRKQTRPLLNFRLPGYAANSWATAVGWPGESVESLTADLRNRWPGVEVRA